MSPTERPSNHPLLFLWARSARNRLVKTARRLKEPRYLLGFIFGLAYFGWIISSIVFGNGSGEGSPAAEILPILQTAAPILLAIFTIIWWVSGRSHLALAFTPAEAEFLFSAPLSRAALVRYKLAKTHPGILFGALLGSFFAGRIVSLPFTAVFLSLWCLMTTLYLHQVGAALVRTSWVRQGRAGLKRNRGALALFVVALGAFLLPLPALVGAFLEAGSGIEVWWALEQWLGQPSTALVLIPFHLLISPLGAATLGEWAPLAFGSLSLVALHYLWVVRTGVAFEETAAEAGVETQALMKAMRRGLFSALKAQKKMTGKEKKRLPRPWFQLKPTGHPAMAIFWKNFTAFTRTVGMASGGFLVVVFAGTYVALLFLTEDPKEAGLIAAVIPLSLIFMLLMMGPLFIRNDLRTDLTQLEIVRTYPLAGRHMVMAGLAASSIALTLTQCALLTLSLIFLYLASPDLPWWWLPPAGYICTLVILFLLNAVGVAVQNILAVNFPAWMKLGPEMGHGIDAMGSQILMMLISLVLLALAFLFPATVAVFVATKFWPMMKLWALIPVALSALATLVGEVVLTAVLLGEAYEALDPAEAGLLK